LAAIHRGTIRALQTFIQHITDYDISQGLPRSYHELGLLLRQLSLCCVQLEVAGEPQVPDSVMTLLKDYAVSVYVIFVVSCMFLVTVRSWNV